MENLTERDIRACRHTVYQIFLTVLYFSDLETHQKFKILASKDNTHNIQYNNYYNNYFYKFAY